MSNKEWEQEADRYYSGRIPVQRRYPLFRLYSPSSQPGTCPPYAGRSRPCGWYLGVRSNHSTMSRCSSTDSSTVTASAEIAGKLVLSQGLASSFRPKKYYTIPREALEASLEDIEQFINFFVIEFQRVLFAENVVHTVAGFVAALLSYWLIKVVPFWGLSLIAVSCIYMGPLIYMTNKELIDHHVKNASDVANAQANQLKDLAGHHTARAHETVKSYAGDYSAKAQEYMGNARGRSTSPEVNSSKPTSDAPVKSEPGSDLSASDFPHAPKQVKLCMPLRAVSMLGFSPPKIYADSQNVTGAYVWRHFPPGAIQELPIWWTG